jgi:hypothetical protein
MCGVGLGSLHATFMPSPGTMQVIVALSYFPTVDSSALPALVNPISTSRVFSE